MDHLHSLKIIESSACSCGFKNEDEIHFFLACSLYYRKKSHTSKCSSTHSTFNSKNIIIRNDTYEIEESKIIITEALRFIKESKRFD